MKNKKMSKFLSALLAVVMVIMAMPMSAFAAVASDLPDNMADSHILRALEYTGYGDGVLPFRYGEHLQTL